MTVSECWATLATDTEEAVKALVLAKGLRRLMTCKKLLVIASPEIADDVWDLLQDEFDVVVRLERKWMENPSLGAKAMLWGLSKWKKIVFLGPDVMVARHLDDIFKEGGGVCSKDFGVMVVTPNPQVYAKFLEAIKPGGMNGSMSKILTENVQELDDKWITIVNLTEGNMNLDMKETRIVRFSNPHPLEILRKNEGDEKVHGIMEKALLATWKEHFEHGIAQKINELETIRNGFNGLFSHCTMADKDALQADVLAEELKDSIAVVGMSLRFPGSNTLDDFWDLLINGKDAITYAPEGRWTADKCPVLSDKCKDSQAGFLSWNVDEFDGKFFGISPMELEFVDPQQRLALIVAWEALEHAGIDPSSLHKSRTGVFGGQWRTDYREALQNAGVGEAEFLRSYLGNSLGVLTARISHCLGLTGPSVSTESGCSSSIVAVDLACRSLRNRETDLTLACGVNLLIHPFTGKTMNTVLAPDGRCKTFDASADGFGRAEGCGVLVLKRYADAVADGDRIWGLIRGSAVVQEGVSKSLGTPTVHCESLAMELALEDAGVEGHQVSFVEMHGTGTPVGDPLEVMAVEKVYSKERKSPLVIGSVKTNIGHTESCSGIAGVIKVILAFQHEVIPPHIHFKELNPNINLDRIPAEIPLKALEWKRDPKGHIPRIAGVSSFGITGTDAHMILQEPPTQSYPSLKQKTAQVAAAQNVKPRPLHVLTLSAKSEDALAEKVKSFRSFLENSNDSFQDIAHSCNTGRSHFPYRAVVLGSDNAEVAERFSNRLLQKVAPEEEPKICFLFTGQGSQYPGMAKALYDHNLTFKVNFDRCDRLLCTRYGINIKDALWGKQGTPWGKEGGNLSRTIYSQTSIFCIEYCLLQLWASWGVKPDYVMGHSLGEFAAAVGAGILSFDDALKLVAERSRLIDALPGGKMLVLKETKVKVDILIKKAFEGTKRWLDYAAVNSPDQTVVAGSSEDIIYFAEFCKNNQIKTHVLEATHAFHSRHMDPMLDEYRTIAETISYSNPKNNCVYVSGMEGRVIEDNEGVHVNADYWVRHTRDSVRFAAAARELMSRGCSLFLEVGPQPVLSALTMINSDGVEGLEGPVLCLPSIRKQEDDWTCIFTTLAKLYLEGVRIDWDQIDELQGLQKCDVPFYPFQNKSFWFEIPDNGPGQIHPLVGSAVSNASHIKLYQNQLCLEDVEFLRDHVIGNKVIYPGAGFLEMCIVAGHAATQCTDTNYFAPVGPVTLSDFAIESPLCLAEKEATDVQAIVTSEESGDTKVTIYSKLKLDKETQKWIRHASATFSPYAVQTKEEEVTVNLDEILNNFKDVVDVAESYGKLAEFGLKFGPTFQTLKKMLRKTASDTDEILFQVSVTESPEKFVCHPVVMDAMFQAVMTCANPDANKLHVPVSVTKFISFGPIPSDATECYIYCKKEQSGDIRASLLDQTGVLVAQMDGATLMETTAAAIMSALESQRLSLPDMYEDVWRAQMGPWERRADLESALHFDISLDPKFTQRINETYNVLTEDDIHFNQVSDQLYAMYMIKGIYDLGLTVVPVGMEIHVKDFVKKYSILPALEGFVRYMFFELEKDGYVKVLNPEKDKLSFKVIKEFPEQAQLTKQIEYLYKKSHAISPYEVDYASSTGTILAQILTGKESALPRLFPEDPSHVSAEAFYLNARMSERTQKMVDECLTHYVKDTAKVLEETKSTIRILEVGAGTGSFTKTLIHHLQGNPSNWEYTYTDLSPIFFANGQKVLEPSKIKTHYKILDIEQDVVTQGFVPGHYDIIVANNVIHATKSISTTTRNLKNLLRENGTLLVSESCGPSRPTNLTFGLLDAYWHYEQEDFQLRGYNTEISDDKWKSVLKSVGFTNVSSTLAYGSKITLVIGVNSSKSDYFVPKLAMGRRKGNAWWIFTDDGPVSNFLYENLQGLGNKVFLIHSSNIFERKGDCEFMIRTNFEADMGQVMKATKEMGLELEASVFLWGLKALNDNEVDQVCEPFLYLCKTMIHLDHPELYVVTRNILNVVDQDVHVPTPSPLWGMAKCFQNEQPNATTRCIDLDDSPSITEDHLKELFSELVVDDQEIFVAYRGNQRLVPRLLPWKPQNTGLSFPKSERFHLVLPASNAINDLRYGAITTRPVLEEGHVECRVKSYGLNFRDVFAVLKPIAEFEKMNTVGIDWSGVVTAIGPGVTKLKVGDSVFSTNLRGDSLPSHNIMHEDILFLIPDKMTFNEAATIPTVAATAYLCLVEVAKLKQGDTILIHTASGGVGLVAIQIAQSVGARIVATAGSKRKRAYLKNLGIEYIFNSRNTNYEHEVRQALGGGGVDVVLNSLTSEGFKEASISLCNKGARFVEMSKLNTWSNEQVKELRPDVDYTIVDLSAATLEEMRSLFVNIGEFMKTDVIKPIPYCRFDGGEIREALTYLQKAKHIGKIVVTLPDPDNDGIMPMFNDRSTYLITGGLGGIGMQVCLWMVHNGAKHVALVGRSAPNEKVQDEIRRMNAKGKNVFAMQYNVGDEEQCQEMLERLQDPELGLPPLRGIMHAAGVLSDSIYANQTWEKFCNTYTPKIKGGWNLHKMTLHLPLEHFVMFSSGVASFGSMGQSNHASANFFLDCLASYRHYNGLPATTVNWGQWGQVGVAANIEIIGLKPFSVLQGISALERIMKSQKLQTCVCYADMSIIKQLFSASRRYIEELKLSTTDTKSVEINKEQFWNEFDGSRDENEKLEVVKRFVRSMIRQILKLGKDDPMSDDENFQDLGMDSLMMIEMKNVVQSTIGKRATITVNSVKDCHTVTQLATRLVELLSGDNDQDVPSPTREELIQLIREDSALPSNIQLAGTPCRPSQVKTVLVTGVTGNMGPYFLRELTKRPNILKVYCLIKDEKSNSKENSVKRLQKVLMEKGLLDEVDVSKVEVVVGQVTHTNFGMNDDDYQKLSQEIDAVIHLAVKSNFVDEYKKIDKPEATDIRTINVKGTLNVLEFVVSQRTKLLFHASTIVANSTVAEDFTMSESWPGETDFDEMPNSAYPISKYVCDRLMATAVQERGLPIKVFRFPAVGGDSLSGANVDYDNNQLMLRMMSYLHLGMMPAVPIPFFILPVDTCVDLSLRIFFDDSTPSDLYNIYNPHPHNETELVLIGEELGFKILVLEPDEFQDRLANQHDSKLIHFLKEASGNKDAQDRFVKDSPAILTAYTRNPTHAFVSKKLTQLFPEYPKGIENTLSVIKRDLEYAKKCGVFDKFGL